MTTHALTTLFTPPSFCDGISWVSSTCASTTCDPYYNIVRSTEAECFPSGWATTATLFSPGLICPSGYTIATETTSSYGANNAETLATCCPSGYTYATERYTTWWTTEPCVKTSDIITTITYTVAGVTPTTTTVLTYYTPTIHAMPVGLAWQASDLSLLAATSTTTTTRRTSTKTTGTSSSTGTKTETSTTEKTTSANGGGQSEGESTSNPTSSSTKRKKHKSHLSTAAKAGVGIGVAVGVILIAIVLGAFLYFRKKKENDPNAPQSEGGSEVRSVPQNAPTELTDSPAKFHAELVADGIQENHPSKVGT